MLYVRKCK